MCGIQDQEREALQEQDDEQGDELEDGIGAGDDRAKSGGSCGKGRKSAEKTSKKLEEGVVAHVKG